jgi:regulatory protein
MSERPPRKLDAGRLWEYALRLLSARAHSIGELRQKLLRRAADAEDVPGILARLKEHKYLDDRAYAESFSRARLENEGLGRNRVLSELRKRRVAPPVADQAVADAYRDTDETALIEAYLARKFRKTPLETYLAEPRNLAAAYRRLRSAGFSSATSLRVLKRHAADPEVLDTLGGEE